MSNGPKQSVWPLAGKASDPVIQPIIAIMLRAKLDYFPHNFQLFMSEIISVALELDYVRRHCIPTSTRRGAIKLTHD